MNTMLDAAKPHRCERCGIPIDESGDIVRVACGLEAPAWKKLSADVEGASDRLNRIALDAFTEYEITSICGLTQHVRENVSFVFVFIPRELWSAETAAAWDAWRAAEKAFLGYGHEPDVPAHLRGG